MRITSKFSAVFILSILLCFNGLAQKNFLKEGDKAFRNREWVTAIDMYKKAYAKAKKKEDKALILFKTAECYRKVGDFKQCETWYAKSIKAKYPDPKAYMYLADAKKSMQKYDEAIVEYNNYKRDVPDDPRGDNGIKSCEQAQKWKDNPSRVKVENMAAINSKANDYAPSYADKKFTSLYFVSSREGTTGGRIDVKEGHSFCDLFETKVDKNGRWSTPLPIGGETINTGVDEGPCIITRKGQTIFYTRCGVEKKSEAKCQLYMATKKGNLWSEEKKLPFNVDTLVFAHPFITNDESILFFVSDMQGGQGGFDIWYCTYDKKNKTFGTPVNAGPSINTDGDEMYPYIRENGSLYFSSDGWPGMGGFDLFYAEKKGDMQWGAPMNMQAPMNSAADDYAIIYQGPQDRGYFSSNREGGKGLDDIYSFFVPPLLFMLEGVVTDCKYGVNLEGVVMKLVGSDGTNVEAKTDKNGYYKFDVAENKARYINENTSYSIATDELSTSKVKSEKADAYLNSSEKGKLTTVGVGESRNFKHDFCLIPAEAEIRFPAVLYDIDKAELRPESKDSLNFLYQTLVDNPTAVIELSAHTDARATDEHNQKLSQARAQSCVDYLVEKGIPIARLVAKGYGEKKPLPGCTEAEINAVKDKEAQEVLHQKNRRTVFRVISWDYVDPANPNKPKPKVLPKVYGEEQGYDEPEETTPEGGEQKQPEGTAPKDGTQPVGTTPAATPAVKTATVAPANKPK